MAHDKGKLRSVLLTALGALCLAAFMSTGVYADSGSCGQPAQMLSSSVISPEDPISTPSGGSCNCRSPGDEFTLVRNGCAAVSEGQCGGGCKMGYYSPGGLPVVKDHVDCVKSDDSCECAASSDPTATQVIANVCTGPAGPDGGCKGTCLFQAPGPIGIPIQRIVFCGKS